MAHFTFKARNSSGEIYAGEKDAADRFELYRLIRESGDELVDFKEKTKSAGLKMNVSIGFLTRFSTHEKINFARNLGLMINAGLSLTRALNVIERQSKNETVKKVLLALEADVNKGSTFAEALGKHEKIFPPIFVSMVHAGEQSGTLAESLKAVASQTESTYMLEKRVRGAMMYPSVILTVMLAIGIMMFIFVVPTLTKVFTDLNVPLPITTKVIIAISDAIQNQGLLVALVVIALAAGTWWWFRQPVGKRFWHKLILKVPVIGPLVQEVNAARTAHTLSSLLTSGVGVVESVAITETVVQNVYFKDVLRQAEEAIKKGNLMSKIFAEKTELYPVFFAEMLSVGEETGKIGDMLLNVATYYESDVEQKTRDMSTIIEPVLMVVIGAAVGFFAVSMISPIYSLVNVIN